MLADGGRWTNVTGRNPAGTKSAGTRTDLGGKGHLALWAGTRDQIDAWFCP